MADCIFCKINAGDVPSYTIYEDELVRVFLDVNPVARGHVLVIPKKHYENIFETPDDILAHINIVCKKIALRLKQQLGASGVNVVNASGKDAQQSVFHIHYHVVPRFAGDKKDMGFHGEKTPVSDIADVFEKLQ